MDNTYKYDVMDNITSLVNAGKPQTLQGGKTIGGAITHAYSYDEWDRLIGAKGTFSGGGSKSATYDLRMEYDKLYNVTSKHLDLKQNNLQFAGAFQTGYEFTYKYKEDDPFRLESIDSKQYSADRDGEADTIKRVNSYTFDDNGNLTLQLVDTQKDSAHVADTMGTRVKNHLWDEENRLLAINDNGFVSNYFYDASGERTVKLSKPDLFVYVNSSEKLKGDSLTMKFVGYVSPYLVVTNGGRYTKHIYAGTQRIASKLGDIDAFGADPRRVATAGHDVDNIEPIDYGKKYSEQNDAFKSRFDSLGAKFNGKSLDDYVNGKSFCCSGKNLDEIEKNNTQTAENAKLEDNLYFYHPDHLGSTNLITNFDGEVTQSVAYVPYGEVFVEERNGSWVTPFLFNAKELDEETGLYYYGARYLDPVDARWLSPDPMQGKYPGMSPYNYCAGNPVRYIDPDGRTINDEESLADAKHLQVSAGVQRAIYKSELRAGKGDKEDLQNKIAELTQTIQDVDDMISDKNHDYKFRNVSENYNNVTTATDEKNILISYNTIGTKAHESRHGGQIARGEMTAQKIADGTYSFSNYTVGKEVDAYRAQVAMDGFFTTLSFSKYLENNQKVCNFPNPDVFYRISVDKVNQVTEMFVNDIMEINEFGQHSYLYNFR